LKDFAWWGLVIKRLIPPLAAVFKQNLLTIKDKIPFKKVNDSALNFTNGSAWEKGINIRAGQLMNKFKNYHNKGCQMIMAYDNFIRLQMVMASHD
jgi:hypothetical protein